MSPSWWDATFAGVPLWRWGMAFVLLAAFVAAQRWVAAGLGKWLKRLAAHSKTRIDDVLLDAADRPVRWLLLLLGVWFAVRALQLPDAAFPLLPYFDTAVRALFVALGWWFLWRLADGLFAAWLDRARTTPETIDDQLVIIGRKTVKLFLIITGVIVIVQNLGFSVSGLIASLGLGGLAVAMAAKDTIANFFGTVMILIDRPFAIGDWIKTSSFEGVVEEIGFRSTRIRTFEKTLVVVPNAQLANMVIDNIDARPRRRVKMRIGLTYDTTPEKMQQAIEGIERILREHPGVDSEFFLVKFDEFEDSSLSIFLYYFTISTRWAEHLQVRQEVNLAIMRLLEELGLQFAFPTRTVHLVRDESSATG